MTLLEHYDDGAPINIGVGEDVTIKQLAETVARVVGFEGRLTWDTSKPDGTPRKLLDVSRINSLGWKASIGLEDGIRSTYAWFTTEARQMTSHKALVIGINYGPEHSGIAPYTTAAAEHLAKEGHSVQVVTGVPHYPSWTVPDKYRRTLETREAINGVAVARLLHFVPTRQSALLRALYELSFAVHAAWRLRKWRGDTVVAVIPSLLSAVTAAVIARRSGSRLVVWVQDSMTAAADQSGMPGGGLAAKVLRPLEAWILRRASAVAVVSDSFREHAESFGVRPESIEVVRNWSHVVCSDGRPRGGARPAWSGRTGKWCCTLGTWASSRASNGSSRPRRLPRTPTPRCCSSSWAMAVSGRPWQSCATGLPNLTFVDPVSQGDFMDTLAAADILLVCESPTVLDMSLPSKLTSYMAAGRPIVGAVRPDGATARELDFSGAGQVVDGDGPESLVRAIATLIDDPAEMERVGERGQAYAASDLSPAASLAKLADLVTAQ